MKFIWIEIKKFLKNNITKILIGTVLITMLFIFFTERNNQAQIENVDEELQDSILETDSRPGVIRFYVETSIGDVFTNNLLIEEYLTRPILLTEVSEATEVMLEDIIEQTNNKILVNYNASGESKILGVEINSTSYIQEFYVNVGNEDQNLEIANYYYNFLLGDKSDLLTDKVIHILKEPHIKEIPDINNPSIQETNKNSIFKNILIGIIFGILLSTGGVLLRALISKKLTYMYSYSLRSDDYYYLIDDGLDNSQSTNIFANKSEKYICIISEDNNTDIIKNEIEGKSKNYSSVLEIEIPEEVKRIIYVIQEGTTTRAWYNNQRQLDKMYKIPIMVVQVNQIH